MLVDLSVTIIQVTIFAVIMQLDVSAALIQVKEKRDMTPLPTTPWHHVVIKQGV